MGTGYIIQQNRIKESMRRVDFEGVLYRRLSLKSVQRRVYNVRAPLSLWHIAVSQTDQVNVLLIVLNNLKSLYCYLDNYCT